MKGADPYIDAALASLAAGLPARITAYNAGPGPDLVNPPNTSYFFGGKEKMQAAEFPAVEVAAPQTDYSGFSLMQVDVDVSASVVVVIWVQEPTRDMPLLYRKALGYERCALEVLIQPDAFGSRVIVERAQCFRPKPNPESRQFEHLTLADVLAFTLGDYDSRPLP